MQIRFLLRDVRPKAPSQGNTVNKHRRVRGFSVLPRRLWRRPFTQFTVGADGVELSAPSSSTAAAPAPAANPPCRRWLLRLTSHSGDGAHVGHRVAITRAYIGPENPVPPIVDTRYEKFETSGLEVTVDAKDNDVKLTLNRVKKR